MKIEKIVRIIKDIDDIDLAVSYLQSQITSINQTEYDNLVERIEKLEHRYDISPHNFVCGGQGSMETI